ncbi:universal stress protein [Candidatus Nitrososphaera evergladensis]|nr:universal stress protein [Candidatus Nitrososphaera evergladensis]
MPYDGSEPSEKALGYAADLARSVKENSPQVFLLYVVPEIHLPPSLDYGMKISYVKSSREYLKELYQGMKEAAVEMLADKKMALEETLEAAAGANAVKTLVRVGNPVEQILTVAKDNDVDLIIIGSGRLTGIRRITSLGSVARAVSERSMCPVMLVH